MVCPRCGGDLVLRSGKYGAFYGCSNYPDCTYTKKVGNKPNYEYGDETFEYIESQTLRKWNPSSKKWSKKRNKYDYDLEY